MIGMTFSLFRDFIQYQKEIKERFKMINKSHMPSLATSLYTENLPQIKNIISGILSVQDMVYLEIKLDDDEENKVAYKGGVKGKENVLSYKIRVVYTNLDDDDSYANGLSYNPGQPCWCYNQNKESN